MYASLLILCAYIYGNKFYVLIWENRYDKTHYYCTNININLAFLLNIIYITQLKFPPHSVLLDTHLNVLVSLAQLVRTMHNICKVRGSNPRHHKKIKNNTHLKKILEKNTPCSVVDIVLLIVSFFICKKKNYNHLIIRKMLIDFWIPVKETKKKKF